MGSGLRARTAASLPRHPAAIHHTPRASARRLPTCASHLRAAAALLLGRLEAVCCKASQALVLLKQVPQGGSRLLRVLCARQRGRGGAARAALLALPLCAAQGTGQAEKRSGSGRAGRDSGCVKLGAQG